MEGLKVKKNVGPLLALYPTPLVVVGAMNGDKPTWTLVGNVGVIGHDRVLVSLAAAHFINGCIRAEGKLSLNVVEEAMLSKADYVGSFSGAKVDKSSVFECSMGPGGTPMIEASPLTMECCVADVYRTEGFESFICTISDTFVNENHLNEEGKVSYRTLKPVLFEYPTYGYLRTGVILGRGHSFHGER